MTRKIHRFTILQIRIGVKKKTQVESHTETHKSNFLFKYTIFWHGGKFYSNMLSSSGEKSESLIKSFTLYMSPAGSFYSSMHIPLPWPSNGTKQGLQACRQNYAIAYSNLDNKLQKSLMRCSLDSSLGDNYVYYIVISYQCESND